MTCAYTHSYFLLFQEAEYISGIEVPAAQEAGAQELRIVGTDLQGQEEFY